MSRRQLSGAAPFATGKTLGEALLTPTRIYVKPVLPQGCATEAIKALAHITGGGFLENIPRVLPANTVAEIDLACRAPPPVFGWLQKIGSVSEREMLRTFNCGIGMIAVVRAAESGRCGRATLEAQGETVVDARLDRGMPGGQSHR